MTKKDTWFKRSRTESGRGWRKWEVMETAVGPRAKQFFESLGAETASKAHVSAVRLPEVMY